MTYKIIVEHLHSKIEGELTKELCDKIYMICAYHPPGYHFGPSYKQMIYYKNKKTGKTEKRRAWDGYISFFRKDTQIFSTGFLYNIKQLFKENSVKYKIIDNRQYPTLPEITDYKLYDDELGYIELRDYQKKTLDKALKLKQCIIKLPTGSGKSEVAASLIKNINQPTLFLVHQQSLALQTKQRFEQRLKQPIGLIGISQFEPQNITIATIQTLWSKRQTTKLKKYLKTIYLVIADECHHLKSKSWTKSMNKIKAPFRYGLSATPNIDGEGKKLLSVTGRVISCAKTKTLIKKGILAKPLIKIYKLNCSPVDDDLSYQEAYKEGITNNFERNEHITKMAYKYYKHNKKILILINELAQAEILFEMIKSYDNNINVSFLSGKDSAEKRDKTIKDFENNKIDIILASVIFDEGIDIKCINVLILGGGGKSSLKSIQRVGRSLRKMDGKTKVLIIDFWDNCNKYLLKHSKKRLQTYQKEGFDIKKIKIRND